MGPNNRSPRNSLSEYELPTKPLPLSHADFEAHGFEGLRRRSSSWSSTTSESRLPTRTTSPEVPSILSGRRNSVARPESIISHISQSSALSASSRNSGDHNLIKLAAKNRSRVSLQSKSSSTQGRRSMGENTISLADALAEANPVAVSAAGFAFKPFPQNLAAPHSGNARMPTPVPEEGGTVLDHTAVETVSHRPLPYTDAGSSTEEAISRRVSKRSTVRPENPVQLEPHRKSQRGIKGFGGFVKRGFKRLPSRLQTGVVRLMRIQQVLRYWEYGKKDKEKGKEREVELPEPELRDTQRTTTDALTHVATTPIPIPGSSSPVVASPPPSPSLPAEPTSPVPHPPSRHVPGPVEELFPGAAGGTELDRRQLDVSSTQQVTDFVRSAMSEALVQPEQPVIVAMRVP